VAVCPRCNKTLEKRKTRCGIVYACATCHGRQAALAVLRRAGATAPFLKQVWRQASDPWAKRSLKCPHCNRPMSAVAARWGDHQFDLDVCAPCTAVWFDRGEMAVVPTVPRTAPPPELSEAAREKVALFNLHESKEQVLDNPAVGLVPPEGWQWLPGILGLPVEYEAPERKSRSWTTWAVVAVTTLVFLALMGNLPEVIRQWGFIPDQWARHGGLTSLTSFFIHGGLFHLLSNMYFLLIFGDNVEDDLGPFLFVLLLLGAAVFGDVVHAAFEPRGQIPCVGASGGIFAVLGYYSVMFPRAKIGVLIWWLVWINFPAVAWLLFYLVIQMLGAVMQMDGHGNASCLAHLGGLAVGIVAAMVARTLRSRPPEFG
jgi:membrane associated rhomboid family serine protease/Zn-finger nucleic acid-binding protein